MLEEQTRKFWINRPRKSARILLIMSLRDMRNRDVPIHWNLVNSDDLYISQWTRPLNQSFIQFISDYKKGY